MESGNRRLIVVSNRLPYMLGTDEQGVWRLKAGSGGLVTALVPVLRNRGGTWIGWSGTTELVPDLESILAEATRDAGYTLKAVALSARERDQFYYGYANEVLWPLFHDLPSMCNFDPAYWEAYVAVNARFAEAIATATSGPEDFIWVHDYHLMMTAAALRLKDFHGHLTFFLHIPFPSLDLFLKIPDRLRLLRGLLDFDLIGFQTRRDLRNFIQCVRTLIKSVSVRTRAGLTSIRWGEHTLEAGSFPIGIDFNEFAQHAESEDVAKRAWYIHEAIPHRQLILGVDRLDYTKGIPHRLEAFRLALMRHPELRNQVAFIQIVVPSRADIPRYASLKTEIERLVGEINGQFTCSGWVPVHYIYRNIERPDLLAYYRTAEIALITPLKDGMNLVCKEYCAANIEENGVLILSEFAGAAMQLQRGALLVNPFDVAGVAEALYRACTMSPEERRTRMRAIRRVLRVNDIFWWVDDFIRAAIDKDLSHFPVQEDFVPGLNEQGSD